MIMRIRTLRNEYAKQRKTYGILTIFSLFGGEINLAYSLLSMPYTGLVTRNTLLVFVRSYSCSCDTEIRTHSA